MRPRLLALVIILLFPVALFAADYLYCPQNHGYIKIGMTESQVIGACGQPLTKENASRRPVKQKVPVKELLYTHLNRGSVYPGLNAAFYEQWSLPSGSTGVSVEVAIIDQEVASIRINGSDRNAMTICGGRSVTVGSPESSVYTACGSPDLVNNTFIYRTIPTNQRPEIWVYQVDQFQSPFRLTFINGKLQSID